VPLKETSDHLADQSPHRHLVREQVEPAAAHRSRTLASTASTPVITRANVEPGSQRRT
jgi:hypothetical protein